MTPTVVNGNDGTQSCTNGSAKGKRAVVKLSFSITWYNKM